MSLTPHNDDSRGEGPAMPATQSSSEKNQKPKRGRPVGSAKRGGAIGLRGKSWWLMRQLPLFTLNELLETYADGTEKNAHNNLEHYLSRLESCDVVERLKRRAGDVLTSPGYVVWRLKRNLGALAPVWRTAQKVLWDPNAGQIVPFKAAQTAPKNQQVPSEPDSHD